MGADRGGGAQQAPDRARTASASRSGLFDVTRILAYALGFIAVMLAIETFLVQPFERHVARWRPRPA